MFDLYRQAQQRLDQQRQEASQAAWALLRAAPWRLVTLPLSLTLALLLEWAIWRSGEHSLAFWWLTALGVSAVMLGNVHLLLYAQAALGAPVSATARGGRMKPPYQPGDRSPMRHTLIMMILSSGLLAGCTVPLLQDMNASLKSVNANLRGVNDSLRGASGMPPATVAASTSNACDQTAFEAGFKAEYVLNWNWGIHDKETLYKVKSQQYPQDAATRHNYALYQGKQMIGKKINKEVGYGAEDYGLKIDNNWHIQNDCQARSYQEGKMAGGTAAMHDLQALEAQEV